MSPFQKQHGKSALADTPLAPLPASGVVGARHFSGIVLLILALYLGAAIAHASLVPTGATGYQNAPDEAAHVAYVRILASGRLPTQKDASIDATFYEWHQPPLYYALAMPLLATGPRGMRGLSILLGLIAVTVIYRTAWLLFPAEPETALVAAGTAALIPGHIAISSTVNNDILLEVCFSCAVLALVISLRSGLSMWRAGWLGVALGCAMLSKSTGILLIPLIVCTAPLLRLTGESWSNICRGSAWCLAVCAVVCGWWYARNATIYHEWVPFHAFEAAFAGTAQAADIARMKGGWPAYWEFVAGNSFQSFWAVYGTPRTALNGYWVFLPATVYQLLAGVCLIALVGLGKFHVDRRSLSAAQRSAIWIMFLMIGLVAGSFVVFLAKYFQTQGRYLYPAMSSICVVLTIGWLRAFPRRYRRVAGGMLLCLLGLVTLIFLSAVQVAVS